MNPTNDPMPDAGADEPRDPPPSGDRRLMAIIDALADFTLMLDEKGLVEWQSPKAERELRGHRRGIGVNPLESVHPEDLPGVLDIWAEAVAHPGRPMRYVARTRALDDDDVWRWTEINGVSELGGTDLDGLIVQVRYLGDRELVESVGETDGEFVSLADAAPIGIAVGDAWGRTVYRNAAAKRLLDQHALHDEREWRELAREEFREHLDQMVHDALFAGRVDTTTAAFVLPDGSTRWLRVHVTPRFTDGQQTIGLITTLEDVTPEVEARAETDRFHHMLDATSDFVAIFRPDGEILYVNAATQALLKELEAEGSSGRLADLIDDEPRRAWIAAALDVLVTSNVWQGELTLNGGGGRKIPVSAMGVVRRSPEGDLEWVAMHARDISELKEAEEQLRQVAATDHLTGLPNRLLFNDRLDQAVARHKRERRGVAVMFCDLDGFKEINDGHGHAAGDQVLVTIADRLREITRESDTAARVGGDEFVIVCEGVTDTDELATLAERVIEAVGHPIELADGTSVHLGISVGVGVARSRQQQVDTDKLLTLADTAMYRAKARGGNRFRITALVGD